MSSNGISGTDWTDSEIDLIVADYFEMLRLELERRPYIKSERNAEMQRLTGRSRGSIEFKHQNISAILLKLGMPWISGYKPRANYQNALLDGVERYISSNDEIVIVEPELPIVADEAPLFIGPTPAPPNHEPDPPRLRRLIGKFDPAARDERNRILGRRGEERVLVSEKAKLRLVGRDDLARKVRWISQEEGDGAGYDILSFSDAGQERLLEVKTTAGHIYTPFFLSSNERALSDERPESFRIFRVYDFVTAPKAFEVAPPLQDTLILDTANYRASFK